MKHQIVDDYYTPRKSKLLKDFGKTVKRVRKVFVSYYGADLTDTMIRESRQEYEILIPQLPYIGGKQPFTQFVIASGWYLAIYKVAKTHGKTVEETGKLIYDVTESYLNA